VRLRSPVRYHSKRDVRIWHIAAKSQCGRMSAAGESGPCIVIATCAGGSRRLYCRNVKTIVAQQRRCIWLKFLIGEPMSTRETPIAKDFVRQFGLRAGRRRERGKAEGEGEFFLHGTVPVRREISKRGRLAHSAVCV
jgi:hypothetical protein